jgi:uncharacterized protein YijF (DUF1287 family)
MSDISMVHRISLRIVVILVLLFSCSREPQVHQVPRAGEPVGFVKALSDAALDQTRRAVRYDASYRTISYPGGDVPADIGVCTDVVIRSYRTLGIDLQREVHEEMKAQFEAFPKKWHLREPDTNIDHRRVPNLQVFFSRRGIVLPITENAQDYQPGDIVTWSVWTRPHIGLVVDRRSLDGKRFTIVHNIGRGQQLEDMLFDYTITGHYRYYGAYSEMTREAK